MLMALACAPAAPTPVVPALPLAPGVLAVAAGDTWAYLLLGPERAAWVDTGSDPSGRAVLAALAAAGRTPAQVEAIVLTHGHRQQWAATHLFPAATLHMGAADRPWVQGQAHPRAAWARLQHRLAPARPLPQEPLPVLPGSRLVLAGQSWEAVALPGHTLGSLALVRDGLALVGDALVCRGGRAELPSRWLSEWPAGRAQAVVRLRPYGPLRLGCSDGGVSMPDSAAWAALMQVP